MLSAAILPRSYDNSPGDLTEVFEAENLIGWISWQGPAEIVVPENLERLIRQIKTDPAHLPTTPPVTNLSLVLIRGDNANARFNFLGGAMLKIQRGDKLVILEKNSAGKLLESDQISFQAGEKTDQPPLPPDLITNNLDYDPVLPLPTEQIYSSQSKYSSIPGKRPILYLLLITVLVLVSSVLYQLRSRGMEIKLQAVTAIQLEADKQIKEASALTDLNAILARSQLAQARANFVESVNKALGPNWQTNKSTYSKKLLNTLHQIDQALETVSRTYRVAELATFYDFTFLKSGAAIQTASLYDSALVALDAQTGTVFSLATNNKSAAIITSQEKFKSGKYLDFFGAADKQYAVFTPEDIVVFPKNTTIAKSASWGNVTQMKAFAGNIYLLDPGANMIWKYTATETGYSDAKAYFSKDLSINLSKAVDFAIDGDVFVLTNSGNMAKFSGGNPVNFNLNGLDRPLNNPRSLFTSDKTQNIYILDSGNNRVVVVDKKGNYFSQFLLPDSAAKLTGPVLADETNKKLLFPSGSKIYAADLR